MKKESPQGKEEKKMENMKELNLGEREEVTAGAGGSPWKLPNKKGFKVIQIKRGDCLSKIANRYHTSVAYLYKINDSIYDVNDITAGYYIYVPA